MRGLIRDKFANALALESKRNHHKNWKKANSWLDELAFKLYASGFTKVIRMELEALLSNTEVVIGEEELSEKFASGQKLKVKFVNQPNEDKTLIPVNTTNMDQMWKKFSGTDTKPKDKDKSDIKTSANKFYNDLHKVYDLAKNKKYEKFWSVMSEDILETILNIGTLISDNTIRNAYDYCEKNQQTNGSIKKAS